MQLKWNAACINTKFTCVFAQRNVITLTVVKTGSELMFLYLWRLVRPAWDNKKTSLCSARAHREKHHLRPLSQQNRAVQAKHKEVTTWKRTVTGNRADFLRSRKHHSREAEKKAWNAKPQRREPNGHRKFSFHPLLEHPHPPTATEFMFSNRRLSLMSHYIY